MHLLLRPCWFAVHAHSLFGSFIIPLIGRFLSAFSFRAPASPIQKVDGGEFEFSIYGLQLPPSICGAPRANLALVNRGVNSSASIAQEKQWPRRRHSNGSTSFDLHLHLRQADGMSRYAQQVENKLVPLLTKWGKEGPTFDEIDYLINE